MYIRLSILTLFPVLLTSEYYRAVRVRKSSPSVNEKCPIELNFKALPPLNSNIKFFNKSLAVQDAVFVRNGAFVDKVRSYLVMCTEVMNSQKMEGIRLVIRFDLLLQKALAELKAKTIYLVLQRGFNH